jgi:hypothetical protein
MYPAAMEVVTRLRNHVQSSQRFCNKEDFLEILQAVQDTLPDHEHDGSDINVVRCINLEGE